MQEYLSKLVAVALLLNAPKEYAGYLTEMVESSHWLILWRNKWPWSW
jgi:hypothetical protein